jgi:hypothetical protein
LPAARGPLEFLGLQGMTKPGNHPILGVMNRK